ncbi:hypothetical protein IQ255_07230 [Pleurocapsales cyanobacterium LEGE 10410]|nr:hypothetical protein [Pleurocapsales cyanobacterium LEGE 10410]
MEDPSILIFILILLFVAAVWGFLIYAIVKSHHRSLDIEKGKHPLYTSTSGGIIGWIRYKGPFINLRIYDEFIVISCTKIILFKYGEIDGVEIKKWMGLVPDSVRLVHHKSDAPGRIILGTTNPIRVKEIIDSRLHP